MMKLEDRIDRPETKSTTVHASVEKYQSLQEISNSAETAIGADLHSICIPVPHDVPTHLRIVISSDPNADKVIGQEFPIDAGLAGRVFGSQRPEFINKASEDPQHSKLVDQAAGTKTGEGGILSYPLILNTVCLGVVQFMKHPGSSFTQEDITSVGRFADMITAELDSLNHASSGDPQ